MGDIRVKQTGEGIELWRTALAQKGKHLTVRGSHVKVATRDEITVDLPTFKQVRHGKQV